MKTATANKFEPSGKVKRPSHPNHQEQPTSNWEQKLARAKKNLEHVDLSEEVFNQLREAARKNPPEELSPGESKRMNEDYILGLFSLFEQQAQTIEEQNLELEEKDRIIKDLRQQLKNKSK